MSIAMLVGVGIITAGIASANGGFGFGFGADLDPEEAANLATERFQHQADLLETDVDTVKDAWSQGKRIDELAEELGIDEEALQARMQEEHQARMEERLQSMVDQGVITQEQMQNRLQFMEDNGFQGKGFGSGMGHHHGGKGLGLGF